VIATGQEVGVLRPYAPALDIARNIINLLLARSLTALDESPEDTAELLLTPFGPLHLRRS
jgi:hypothetical protein